MIYRRQRKKPQVTHTDDWLMTYADMITLLLCFFAIFLSVSVPKKEQSAQIRKPQTEQTFPVISLIEGQLPFHALPQTDVKITEEFDTTPAVAAPPPPPEAGPFKMQKGDRITTMEISSAAFFDSGSATLSPAGRSLLSDVSQTLKSDKYKDYAVTVEGHTDDSPINTPLFPSNWELSTARAAAVVRFFLEDGVPAQKLRAAGYADTFPKTPNRDIAGNAIPENQAQNRRVVIKLEKIEKSTL
jgi:chemotaxis protein MotB